MHPKRESVAVRSEPRHAARPCVMTPADPTPDLARFQTYNAARSEFDRGVPDRFNLADAIFKRHHDAVTRVAVVESRPGGLNTYTFNALDYLSDKFAAVLRNANINAGDR